MKPYRRYYTYIEPVVTDPIIRGYFTLVASLLLIAFFLIFALSPTITTILGLNKKIAEQKTLIISMNTKITNLVSAQENYSQIESHLPLLLAALPEKPYPDTVLSGIAQMASSSAVKLTSLQFNAVDLNGTAAAKLDPSTTPNQNNVLLNLKIPTVPFTLEAQGSEGALRNFVGRLEKLSRLLALSTIAFSSSGGSSSYTLSVSGYAFYLKTQ